MDTVNKISDSQRIKLHMKLNEARAAKAEYVRSMRAEYKAGHDKRAEGYQALASLMDGYRSGVRDTLRTLGIKIGNSI